MNRNTDILTTEQKEIDVAADHVASEYISKSENMKFKHHNTVRTRSGVDSVFAIVVLILLCLGTVMVFSASYAYAEHYFKDSFYFVKKQLIYVALGLIVMFVASRIDYKTLFKHSYKFFLFVILLMLLTSFTPLGAVHNGAKRWLELGPISFQPSELMKLAIVLAFSKYVSQQRLKMKSFVWGILIPMVVIGFVDVLMYFQSHMSGMIIMTFMALVMIFLGGCSIWWIIGGGLAACGGVVAFFFLGKGYHGARIEAWLDPFKYPLIEGYQTIQSLYSIAQGGLFGKGIGQSSQKNLFLPEPQNDFIFSIWCEELGFVGAIIVILLFGILVWRGIYIALKASDRFASLVAMGISIKVGLQALLNIAVVTNTIPNTGISLPFFSYGGTSLMFLMIEMGIILSISRYSYIEKR